MSDRTYRKIARNLLEALYILAILSVATAVSAFNSGCSTVELARTDQGVTLSYRTFLTKIEAPALYVDKDGEYSASFNAASKGSDLEVMRDIIGLVAPAKQP